MREVTSIWWENDSLQSLIRQSMESPVLFWMNTRRFWNILVSIERNRSKSYIITLYESSRKVITQKESYTIADTIDFLSDLLERKHQTKSSQMTSNLERKQQTKSSRIDDIDESLDDSYIDESLDENIEDNSYSTTLITRYWKESPSRFNSLEEVVISKSTSDFLFQNKSWKLYNVFVRYDISDTQKYKVFLWESFTWHSILSGKFKTKLEVLVAIGNALRDLDFIWKDFNSTVWLWDGNSREPSSHSFYSANRVRRPSFSLSEWNFNILTECKWSTYVSWKKYELGDRAREYIKKQEKKEILLVDILDYISNKTSKEIKKYKLLISNIDTYESKDDTLKFFVFKIMSWTEKWKLFIETLDKIKKLIGKEYQYVQGEEVEVFTEYNGLSLEELKKEGVIIKNQDEYKSEKKSLVVIKNSKWEFLFITQPVLDYKLEVGLFIPSKKQNLRNIKEQILHSNDWEEYVDEFFDWLELENTEDFNSTVFDLYNKWTVKIQEQILKELKWMSKVEYWKELYNHIFDSENSKFKELLIKEFSFEQQKNLLSSLEEYEWSYNKLLDYLYDNFVNNNVQAYYIEELLERGYFTKEKILKLILSLDKNYDKLGDTTPKITLPYILNILKTKKFEKWEVLDVIKKCEHIEFKHMLFKYLRTLGFFSPKDYLYEIKDSITFEWKIHWLDYNDVNDLLLSYTKRPVRDVLLEWFQEIDDIDSYRFLVFLDTLLPQTVEEWEDDLIWSEMDFYFSYLKLLQVKNYKSKDSAIWYCYNKIFNWKDKYSVVSKSVEKFNEILSSSNDFLRQGVESLQLFYKESKQINQGSVMKFFSSLWKEKQPEKNLTELRWEIEKMLEKLILNNKLALESTNRKIEEIDVLFEKLIQFRSLLGSSSIDNLQSIQSWISNYEWNINLALQRLVLVRDNITKTLSLLQNFENKLSILDAIALEGIVWELVKEFSSKIQDK